MRENASSWVIKILLFIVVIVFVFLGINPGNKKIHDSAAVVNKQAISFQEFDTAYKNVLERYSRQLGDNLSDDVIKMLRIKENTLENLINRAVILQEARKRGIDVNDKELQNLISSVPYFQKGGQFNLGLYNNYFSVTHQNPEVFEDQLRNDFLFKKIKGFVDDTSMVTDDEIREWYAWEKTESSIAYVAFSPDSVKDVTPSKDELTAYYEKHVDSYKSDATAVVKLIQFAPEEFKSKVSVTEKDIENDYNANLSKYELPKTVQARHILIKVAEDADDAAVEKAKTRAQDIYRMATVEKKDFAGRSEERRVGKECRRLCRSRWSPYH
jgi:peptidyl-prolyl cis-trans isomerase D